MMDPGQGALFHEFSLEDHASSDHVLRSVDPETVPRAVREYLDVLDDAAFGAASEVDPKVTSHSDPASQRTGAMKGAPMERQWSERHWRTPLGFALRQSGLRWTERRSDHNSEAACRSA